MTNIFVLPHTNKQYIIYLPIQGIIFKGNTTVVNLFYKALNGDAIAREKFGISKEQADMIMSNEQNPFLQNKRSIRFQPTSLSLFLTSGCSMKCIYCYANGGETSVQIKTNFIETSINEIIKNALKLKRNKITVNYHGGGDIGIVWDLVEQTTEYINRLAKKNNIDVIINTGLNGILSDYQRKWIVENTDSATVSIDGFSEIQNSLRPLKNGSPSFDVVHRTLKYFDAHGFSYAIRTTVTSETIWHLEKIIAFFCNNYEARKIKVEPVFIQGRAFQNKLRNPSSEDFVRHFIKSKDKASTYNRELLYSGARFDILTDTFCLATGSSFCVTPEGYITSCYEVLEKRNPLSDIFFYGKIEGDKIVISQKKLNNLAKLTVNENEKCAKCFARFHCAGDCPAKSILAKENMDDLNFRCEINRELTKEQLLKSIE
jgi:uncharacterized protein